MIVTIQKSQKIIKRGFIITTENYRQPQAYADAGNYIDINKFLGLSAFILCLYIIGSFMFSAQAIGDRLKESRKSFIADFACRVSYRPLYGKGAIPCTGT